ncbi:MAG: SGNH/GDSL hydrolase family protein [Candidatus Sumerlaeota bacterium]|nr:SGNH/GDSL hydrolase family protein [Candidatus Sumerlaeota bacterium]
MNRIIAILASALCLWTGALWAAETSKTAAPVAPAETDARLRSDGKGWRLDQAKIGDPTRPRVLLMGDSILNGYLPTVVKALDGKAYVDAWVNPYCQASFQLDRMIAEVLAKGPYDVIHFNMGLHGWQKGRIPEGQFEPLTRQLVENLRKGAPKAKLIWASSTPVTVKGKPTELDPEINPVIIEHNRMAAKVMKEMDVPVNDFYALLAPKLELARGDQFHWTAPGYKILADALVAQIVKELPAAGKATANATAANAATTTAAAIEPSNAKELAEKKAAEDKAVDEKFQQWKAALPPEQQAWETTLEQNLGSFYLPLYKREKVRGSVSAWDYVKDDPKLPRVLLIGDSVSRGYTLAARQALAGKANVHRAPENCGPTANGLKKLDVWLGQGKWDVIHFNFGIHDRATKPADYEQRMEQILMRLQKTGAKLIWASTTPIPPDTKDGAAAAEAIVEKNRIAARVMEKHSIATDDLFAFITPHVAKVQNPKDVHFNGEGYELLGKQVATSIEAALK